MEACPAAEEYDKVLALERNLLAASTSKGFSDPAVRRLRTSIRDGYEGLILRDLAFSEAFGVEQALWRLHYREIEGFRLKIRTIMVAREETVRHEPATGQRKKRKKENRMEPLLRVLASFRSFLAETSGFFHGLLIKLKLQHRLASSLGTADRFSPEGEVTEDLHRCMVACNRILVYLGDLARYKELYAVMDSSERDWSVAAHYYKQAAVLWPSSGNPYNQLAVLCVYCANSLTALYLYCRSLAVNVPFETAWDNIFLLLDKNKQLICNQGTFCLQNKQLIAPLAASGSDANKRLLGEIHLPTNLHGFVIEQDLWLTHKIPRSQGWFLISFIELIRILLIQSSSDELEKALKEVESRHEQFLSELITNCRSSKLAGSSPLALQMTIVLIFCMHHINGRPGLNGEYALNSSLRFTLRFCSMMAKVAHEKLRSVFPVTVILMEWLASETKVLHTFFANEGTVQLLSDFYEKVTCLGASLNNSFDDDLGCDAQMLQHEQNVVFSGRAQWEDHELLGFLPLACVHLNLDFSSPPPGYGISNWATNSCWMLRCKSACKKIVNMVGQSEHGCLLKMPDEIQCNRAVPEESHQTPSLKEWIGKSFLSADLCNDLVHAKLAVVSGNQAQACLPNEMISTANPLEHANLPQIVFLTSAHANGKPGGEVSKEETMLPHRQVLDQKQALINKKTILTGEDISSTNSFFEKMMSSMISVNIRQGANNLNCEGPIDGIAFINQPSLMEQCDRKSAEKEKDAGFSFRNEATDLVQRKVKAICHLHEHKAARNKLCFDSISHKSRELLESFSFLRSKYLNHSMGLGKDSNAYSTQNPFVLRLRHICLNKEDVHTGLLNPTSTVKSDCVPESGKERNGN